MSIRDHIIQWAREREPVSINEIAEHVQILFEKQAAAAKRGMDAAKAHGSHMEAEAKRLHAECNLEALESERQANAELTEELDALRSERAALLEQVVYWRECGKDMVAKAAANSLDGYRELGQRAAKAEAERDGLREQLGKSERLARRADGAFRTLCSALQQIEEMVGIDSGEWNGPGEAMCAVEQIVKERDALAARLNKANRPENCRNELQLQGQPYPRSGCAVCGNGGLAGCPYEAGRKG